MVNDVAQRIETLLHGECELMVHGSQRSGNFLRKGQIG